LCMFDLSDEYQIETLTTLFMTSRRTEVSKPLKTAFFRKAFPNAL
jgi:hypothetical protein